jgi:hypothetical protein
MMSGARAMISSAVTIRSFADFPPVRSAKNVDPASRFDHLRDPADAGDHRLVPFREIHLWAPRQVRRSLSRPGKPGGELVGNTISTICRTDHRPEHADHVENLGDSVRWLKAWTATPCRTSTATISACRSEKLRARQEINAQFGG